MARILKNRLNIEVEQLNELLQHTYEAAKKGMNGGELERRIQLINEDIVEINKSVSEIKKITEEWTSIIVKLAAKDQDEAQNDYEKFIAELDLVAKMKRTGPFVRTIKNTLTGLASAKSDWEKIEGQSAGGGGGGPTVQSGGTGGSPSSGQTPGRMQYQVEIAKIKPQNFMGGKMEWNSWWPVYNLAIHTDPSKPKFLKMADLLSLLKGEARDLVLGLQLTDADYDLAIKTLTDRYDDNSHTVRELHRQLIMLKASQSFEDDKKLLVDIMRITRMLKSNLQDTNAPTIWLTLEQKVSKAILRQLQTAKVAAGNNWDTDKFIEKLKEIVTAEEAVEDIYFQSHSRKEQDKKPRGDMRQPPRRLLSTVQTRVENKIGLNRFNGRPRIPFGQTSEAQRNKPQQMRQKACNFCGAEHWSSECNNFREAKARLEKAKDKKLCLKCLGYGHITKECPAKPRSCWYCKKMGHNKAFCPQQFGGQKTFATQRQSVATHQMNFTSEDSRLNEVAESNFSDNGDQRKLLLSKEITVFNPDKPKLKQKVLAFFDSGSERSYVSKELAQMLKLKAQSPTQIKLVGFAETDLGTFTMRMTKVGVVTTEGQRTIESQITDHLLRDIAIVKAENVPEIELQKEKLSVPMANLQPQILVGVDHYSDFNIRPEQQLPSGFWVATSTVGKFLCGKGLIIGPSQGPKALASFTVKEVNEAKRKETDHLNQMLERFFSLEMAGMGDALQPTDNEQWLTQFKNGLRFNEQEGRYEVPLPWNEKAPELKSNYGLARGRLEGILKKLNQEEFDHYNETIQNQLKTGIVELVPNPREATGVLHYLPHQAVVKINHQTTKLRIVYDGSAHVKDSPSLNQCLDKGPQLLNDLVGILLRCRLPKILISADIEKAFLQILIREEDRDALRFLWLDETAQVKTFRFRRVPFGLISSPAHLAVTLRHHFELSSHPLAQQIADNIYVDNVLLGLNEDKEIEESCREMKQIFAEANMNLREFASNLSEQMKPLPKDWLADQSRLKILGVKWNPLTDMLEFQLPPFLIKEVTKRKILAHLASVFDPLGLLSPVLLPGKVLLSKLWSEKYDWDQELDDQLKASWWSIHGNWTKIEFKIPRRICSSMPKEQSVHIFADASGFALGICAYIRSVLPNGIESNLIFAKSLVVPLKTPGKRGTIPRLELQALKIATKAAEKIQKELKVPLSVQLWTDSRDVVDWLKSTKKQERYVENRLKKIRQFSVGFISGITNPADIASRGSCATELVTNKLWLHGPDWLQKSEIRWSAEQHKYKPETDHPDLKEAQNVEISLPTTEASGVDQLIDPKRFSTWTKLRSTMGMVFRALGPKTRPSLEGTLQERVKSVKAATVEELQKADKFLIKMAQREHPPDKQSEMNLNLFTDDQGILRTKGRIQRGDIEELAKNPIFLPKKSEITHLIISAAHRKLHAGTNYVLAKLRQKYWIPQARRTIRQIIQSARSRHLCRICLKFKTKPFSEQPMPQLPKFRVDGNAGRPFLNVGLDYFGPMMTRIDGKPQKVWACLFTCAVTRGIHIELVNSLSAEAFLQAFSRFCSRRKTPKLIVSDNAKTFKLGAKAVAEIWHHPNIDHLSKEQFVQKEIAQRGVKWRFNVERAPWRGGFFEKMVHLVKEPLRKSLGKRLVDIDELATTLIEIEKIVNDRPLTFISEAEMTTILRPIDFISPYSDEGFQEIWSGEDPNMKDSEFVNNPTSKQTLVQKFKKAREMADKFWTIWRNDYLTSLREKQKSDKCAKNAPKVGEIVIIHDDCPRNQWKIAKVKELIPSSDGLIRTAIVSLGGTKELRRPINKLFPLEIDSPKDTNDKTEIKIGSNSPNSGMDEEVLELDYEEDERELVPAGGQIGESFQTVRCDRTRGSLRTALPRRTKEPEKSIRPEQQIADDKDNGQTNSKRPWKWAKAPPIWINSNRKRPRSASRRPSQQNNRPRQQSTPHRTPQALASIAKEAKRPRTPLPRPEDGSVLLKQWQLSNLCTLTGEHDKCKSVVASDVSADLPKIVLPSLLHVIVVQIMQEYSSDRDKVAKAIEELRHQSPDINLIAWACKKKEELSQRTKPGVSGMPTTCQWKKLHGRGIRQSMWWRLKDVNYCAKLWFRACVVAAHELKGSAVRCEPALVVPATQAPADLPATPLLRAMESDVELALLTIGYPEKKLLLAKVVVVADPQTQGIATQLGAFLLFPNRVNEFVFTSINEMIIVWTGAEAVASGQGWPEYVEQTSPLVKKLIRSDKRFIWLCPPKNEAKESHWKQMEDGFTALLGTDCGQGKVTNIQFGPGETTSNGYLSEQGIQKAKTVLQQLMLNEEKAELPTDPRSLDQRLRALVERINAGQKRTTPNQPIQRQEVVASTYEAQPAKFAPLPYLPPAKSVRFFVDKVPKSPNSQWLDEALSDMLMRNLPTDSEMRAKEEVVHVLSRILEQKFGKLNVAGSTLSNTALRGSDLDIVIMPNWTKATLSAEHRGRELLHIRDAIRFRKAQMPTEFCTLIDHTKAPLVKLRTKCGLSVDITLDNETPIRNSKWLLEQANDPQFKQLYLAVKLWTSDKGLGDASRGGLNSLAWAVLVAHFCTKFDKSSSCFLNFARFAEYWAQFPFSGCRVTKFGISPKVDDHVIYVEDPFDESDNVARNRRANDLQRLIRNLQQTTNLYVSKKGQVTLSELGFTTRSHTTRIGKMAPVPNEDEQGFEPDELVFHAIPEGKKDTGFRTVAQEPILPRPRKSVNNRTFFNSKFDWALIGLLLLLGLFTPSSCQKAMICNLAAVPRLVELRTQFGCRDIMEDSIGATLDVFRPTAKIKQVSAAYCNVVNQRTTYWENIIFEERNITVTKSLPTSREECLRMWKRNQCSVGALTGSQGLRRTKSDFTPKVEYSYFHKGESERTNCFLSETTLYYDSKAKTLHSPIGDVTGCRFTEEWCVMRDGAVLVWEIPPPDAECRFEKLATWMGDYHPSEFVWTRKEMALSFPKRVQKVIDCKSQSLVITDQGLAVDTATYLDMINAKVQLPPPKSRHERGKTKTKRVYVVSDILQPVKVYDVPIDPIPNPKPSRLRGKENLPFPELTPPERMRDIPITNHSTRGRGKRDTVHTEQLASELTASQISTMGKLKIVVCWLMQQGSSSTLFAGSDATVVARTVLRQQMIKAQWVSTGTRRILKVWQCLPIDRKLFQFVGTKSKFCTKDLPINLTLPDRNTKAFLNPQTLIISDTSTSGSCSEYQTQTVLLGDQIWTIDQIRGTETTVEEKDIKKVEFGLNDDEHIPSLDPLIFHNFGLFNDSDPTLQTLSLFNAFRVGKQLQDEAHNPSTQSGTWSPMPKFPEINFGSMFDHLISWDLLYKCTSLYILGKILLQIFQTYLKAQFLKWGFMGNLPFRQGPLRPNMIPMVRISRAPKKDANDLQQSLSEVVQELETVPTA